LSAVVTKRWVPHTQADPIGARQHATFNGDPCPGDFLVTGRDGRFVLVECGGCGLEVAVLREYFERFVVEPDGEHEQRWYQR